MGSSSAHQAGLGSRRLGNTMRARMFIQKRLGAWQTSRGFARDFSHHALVVSITEDYSLVDHRSVEKLPTIRPIRLGTDYLTRLSNKSWCR